MFVVAHLVRPCRQFKTDSSSSFFLVPKNPGDVRVKWGVIGDAPSEYCRASFTAILMPAIRGKWRSLASCTQILEPIMCAAALFPSPAENGLAERTMSAYYVQTVITERRHRRLIVRKLTYVTTCTVVVQW